MKKNTNYYILFFFISIFCTWLFTYRLNADQFLYMGDQALRVSLGETSNYAFLLKRLTNMGTPNAWEFVTQFWDSVFFLVSYGFGITSTATIEKILFFIVTFGTLLFSFTGFKKISTVIRIPLDLTKIFFITLWYTFNPYTLNLWHGGIYNIDVFLTYSLAPLSLYFLHKSIFEKSNLRDRIISAILLFLQSFVFWLFAPFAVFAFLYICIYIAVTKVRIFGTLKRLLQIVALYIPLAAILVFTILFEYFNSQTAANASLAPAFGNQQGGLWYQLLMLFSWGIYNVWMPRSLYSFYNYYFSPLYIGGTLTLYGLLLFVAIRYFEQKKLSVEDALAKLAKEKFILIFFSIFLVSLFFAKGAQWPLGEVFLFLYKYVPFFSVFRTPDIRFGFSIVLSLSILLIIASVFYRRLIFGILLLFIILTQTLPFWTGWGIYGQNIGNSFYDRIISVPRDYQSVINFFNSDKGQFGYVLPVPSNEYAIYTLPPDEHHIGQDLLSKYIRLPFIFLSEATGINTRAYKKLTTTLSRKKYIDLRQLPIRFLLIRHDIVCEKCLIPTEGELKNDFTLVFKNKTFSVFNVEGQPLISAPGTTFKQIGKMKYEIYLNNTSGKQQLNFLLSNDSNWKLFRVTDENILGDLRYIWEKPIFEKSHGEINGYANKWAIQPNQLKNARLILYYQPQAYYWLALYVSLATALTYFFILLVNTRRNDEAKRRKVKTQTDTTPSHNHRLTYHMVRKYIKDKILLDIGCWTGQYEFLAKDDAKKIVGIDPGETAIKKANQLFSKFRTVTFKIGFAEKLKFPDSSFDTVLFSEVLEHIPRSSEEKAIKEIERVLKPSGVLILTTPYQNFFSILFDPAFFLLGHRHYSKKSVEKLLLQSDFRLKEIQIVGGFMNLIVGNIELLYKHIFRTKFEIPNWMHRRIESEWDYGFVRLVVIAQKKAKKI